MTVQNITRYQCDNPSCDNEVEKPYTVGVETRPPGWFMGSVLGPTNTRIIGCTERCTVLALKAAIDADEQRKDWP